jgi:hypothetical protein
MEFSSHYDFVVFGEHPAGLWAALQLLEREKRVLILPLGKDSGLNAAPRSVFLDFGIPEINSSDAQNPTQILTPEKRFKIGSTLEEIESEYEFQFGEKPGAQPSNEILRGLAYLARGAETGPVFSEDWKLWAQRALDTVYLEKDPGFLVRAMMRHLSEKGAHITKTGLLRQIFVDKNSLVGIQLEGASRMISARAGLVCVNYDYVKGFLNETLPARSEPIGWRFDMRFECSASALPAGLTSRMLYVESGAPILEILQESPGSFHLRTPLPLSEQSLGRSFQRRLCERMIKVCEGIIPDLEYNLRRVIPDLRDPEKTESIDLPRLFPFDDPHRIPLHHLFYSSNRNLGHQSPVQNLFVVSEESDPRSGLRGAYQAAIQMFESLNKREQVSQYLSPKLINQFH